MRISILASYIQLYQVAIPMLRCIYRQTRIRQFQQPIPFSSNQPIVYFCSGECLIYAVCFCLIQGLGDPYHQGYLQLSSAWFQTTMFVEPDGKGAECSVLR
jgi:hypothetical protein